MLWRSPLAGVKSFRRGICSTPSSRASAAAARVLLFSAMRFAPDGTLLLSPSDLANHLACAHLTQLELRVQRGELARPHVDDPYGRIILREGERARGRLPRRGSRPTGQARRAHARPTTTRASTTSEARSRDRGRDPRRRGGRHLPGLPHGRHLARVRRLPRAAARRHVRARRHEARPLGEAAPRHPALLLRRAARADPGAAARARPRRARLRRAGDAADGRLHRLLPPEQASGCWPRSPATAPDDTWPWPVYHCTICDFRHLCRDQRVAEDHPILVAGLGRLHAERLAAAGITTLTALGGDGSRHDGPAHPAGDVRAHPRARPRSSSTSRARASGASSSCRTRRSAASALLPPPSRRRRLARPRGPPVLRAGARARVPLRLVLPRRRRDALRGRLGPRPRRARRPRSSASSTGSRRAAASTPTCTSTTTPAYERTALRRLMGEHSTREREIDDWLRQELLVDLYRVVKQSLRAGVTSYSIKEIEKLYGFVRTAEVAGGDESVVLFEQWLEAQDDDAARGDPRLQRGGLPLDGRAPRVAARAAAGRSFPGSCRPRSASSRRRPRSATRRGSPSTRRCSQTGRRGARAGSSRISSTTTSARRSRSGGSGSTTSSSTRTS